MLSSVIRIPNIHHTLAVRVIRRVFAYDISPYFIYRGKNDACIPSLIEHGVISIYQLIVATLCSIKIGTQAAISLHTKYVGMINIKHQKKTSNINK